MARCGSAALSGAPLTASEAADKLEFERAALLRDQINSLKSGEYKKTGPKAAVAGRPGKKRQRG